VPVTNYEPPRTILPELGRSLLRHPDAADVLLAATKRDPQTLGEVSFAQAVFKHAGAPMLPVLHKALASPDRVVRSNAARACGAIAHPSSVSHLIKALDLESGLARASIVWALGELKATESLPLLAKLYVDARNDEKRRAGSGFRAAQAQAEVRGHYDSIRDLEAVRSDWDELKAAAAPKPTDPRRDEELLEPRHILEAVRKIGPAASQDFYRALAGEKDIEGRREAALQLAEGGKDDLDTNIVVLRQLLADGEVSVRIRAAGSLLILKQDIAQRPILEWLTSPNDWEKAHTLEQLDRVKDGSLLRFARDAIQAIANDAGIHYETRAAARRLAQSRLP
jgi:HEAT repeat protein